MIKGIYLDNGQADQWDCSFDLVSSRVKAIEIINHQESSEFIFSTVSGAEKNNFSLVLDISPQELVDKDDAKNFNRFIYNINKNHEPVVISGHRCGAAGRVFYINSILIQKYFK